MEYDVCCLLEIMFLKLLITHYTFSFYFKTYVQSFKEHLICVLAFLEAKQITKQQGNKSWLLALENLLVSCLLTAGY